MKFRTPSGTGAQGVRCNTGDQNTGDWNAGDGNTGSFNTITPPCCLFNRPTSMTHDEIANLRGLKVLNQRYENNWWIHSRDMTDAEKAAHPEHETTGGYLKTVPFKDACKLMWDGMDDEEKQAVRDLPNFDSDVFYEITGILA